MEIRAERDTKIMGIVNLTDDSFFPDSRALGSGGCFDSGIFKERIVTMLEQGADILDLGACSTRPGSESVSSEIEWRRLEPALRLLAVEGLRTSVSIDTFRPEIVERAFDVIGPFIVNDVSGGSRAMWSIVARLGLTYVATHTRGTPSQMQDLTDYDDVTLEVSRFFEDFALRAKEFGIDDWILDPGFGFAKTVGQNWCLLRDLPVFQSFGKPVLAGLSRKSFLYKPLGISPSEALLATQVADFAALQGGAAILRVHDVAPAVQTLKLFKLLNG